MSLAPTVSAAPTVQSRSLSSASVQAVSIPWTIWFTVIGAALSLVGASMDLAWHKSIGRESFWTPGHILIGAGVGAFGGFAALYAILTTTWGPASRRNASMRILGLYGPGGAFLAPWSAVAMFSSGPFDDWWHRAYGLDLNFITPPHALLVIGLFGAKIGAMIWIAATINRSDPALQNRLMWLLLIVGAITMIHMPVWTWTGRRLMHSALCYLAVALGIPTIMMATARGSARKWGCTAQAAIYMAFGMASEWLLPLIPAQPKFGPAYQNVTHLIPMQFPLLLIVPAVIADLLLQRLEGRSSWLKAVWVGPAFVLGLLAVQWPFADFLMSAASQNWIFGTGYFAYNDPAGILYDPYQYKVVEKTASAFALTMAMALAASIMTTRLGLAWGDWMRRVRR